MAQESDISAGSGDVSPSVVDQDVLRYFMQSASLPLLALDAEGTVAYCSSHAAEVLQVPAASVRGLNFFAALGVRDQSILKAHVERVIRGRQPSRCEVELLLPNANRQWVRLVSHPGVNEGDRRLCWSTLESLTQIRRLEKTEALYQRAAEIIGKADTLKEFSAQIFDHLRILFGIDNGYVAVVDPVSGMIQFPFFVDKMDPAPEPRKPSNGMTDYVITTGRLIWLQDERAEESISALGFQILGSTPADWIGVPLTSKGHVIGMVAIQTYDESACFNSKDIGLMLGVANLFEVFLNRLELEEDRALLSAAISQAAETIMITDVRGVILYVNPAFEKVTGYTREQVIGKTPEVIRSGKHDAQFYRDMWKTLSAGDSWRGRFINRRADGQFYEEEAVISPVRNKSGDIVNYVAVKRDLTNETRLEKQFIQAQKMEAALKLVESIHHDFSNLLMVVRTNADYLKSHADAVKLDQNELDQIIHATDRGDELMRQLSVFSGADTDDMETIGINQLVSGFEATARKMAGDEYAIRLELSPRAGLIRINRNHVEQMLANLVINAADAMPGGGDIVIRTAMTSIASGDASFFPDAPPHDDRTYAVIEVIDQGTGIAPENVPHIFTSEFTTKNKPGGGLGLPTSLEIMREHRGFIGVKAGLPQGTTVRLLFPLADPPPPEPVLLVQPAAELPRGSETILLAEDDDGARRVVARMLQDQGYAVLEAENGAMAIRHMLGHGQKIHLLISDMMMPDFDGWALSEQVLGLQPGIRVIFISGYNAAEIEQKGVQLSGMTIPLLNKPFRREELLSLVRQVLDA